ncbi:DUF4129 domain-containing protein [Chitinophaga sp. Cy-1792]|uniref:DUF4129 domain-containing protein n=1 Tax=Chitinophaga sp. Cy-1792 TaxID=2608339 RepID=UPI00141EB155|nr:DUF4129 domain-containing protein [Chitinophaga sp. Cy-1792]NIG57059.1 DUF4129 domain-containing protein [Chitinophaga sp. Cy-1792]
MKLKNIFILLSCCICMLTVPAKVRAQDSLKAHYKDLRKEFNKAATNDGSGLSPLSEIPEDSTAADSLAEDEEIVARPIATDTDSAGMVIDSQYSSMDEPVGLPNYNERPVSAEKLASLKKDKDLKYADSSEKDTDTSWSSLILSAIYLYVLAHIYIFRWVLLGLLLAVIGYLLFRYMSKNGLSFFRKPLVVGALKEEAPEEELHSTNEYERKIQEAVSKNDIRQAIRWSYLHLLFLLADAHMIKLAKDRTNKEYVRSLKNTPYYADFSILTMDYEYVWYGGFDISQHEFEKMLEQFKVFNHQISKAGE